MHVYTDVIGTTFGPDLFGTAFGRRDPMARSLRTTLIGLVMIVTLLVGVSAVGASTATATLGAGSLSITAAPANFSYSGTLTGDVLNLSSSFAVGVNDAT